MFKIDICCFFIFNMDVSSQKNLPLAPIHSSYFQKQNFSPKNIIFSIVPTRFLQFVQQNIELFFILLFATFLFTSSNIIKARNQQCIITIFS